MTGTADWRGVLHPERLPTFHREPAPDELSDRIRWFWIPRWNIGPGRTSRQELLPFPASNLVVEAGVVTLSGPTTGRSHRDLCGRGWAVGALLRPAGIAALHPDPAAIRDTETPYDDPGLAHAVAAAMADPDDETGRLRAVAAYCDWARESLAPADENGRLANSLVDLVAEDPAIVRVDQIATHLHVSVRGVQRLAHRYVGLPPLAIIRRYRLQEAARRLREDRSLTIATVAADLGYADHAHLSADFRRVLGFTPRGYRTQGSGESAGAE